MTVIDVHNKYCFHSKCARQDRDLLLRYAKRFRPYCAALLKATRRITSSRAMHGVELKSIDAGMRAQSKIGNSPLRRVVGRCGRRRIDTERSPRSDREVHTDRQVWRVHGDRWAAVHN